MREYKIIAVDFDGTLSFATWPKLGEPNTDLINLLKKWKEKGNKLILWTCREGELLDQAVDWCKSQGLTFDAVNDNLEETIAAFGDNPRKITADYYIDDKALNLGNLNPVIEFIQ